MTWVRMASRLATLPLVLCGPVLRRVDRDSVTVWLALREARKVTLRVYAGSQSAARQIGTRSTVRLGNALHVVAVTATGEALQWGALYEYNLTFGPHAADATNPTAVPETGADLLSGGIIAADATAARAKLLYGGASAPRRPSFATPPTDLNRLRLIHGSCRKLHGMRLDALQILDDMIELNVSQPLDRPHQLWLTGDQIYADDVADALLAIITDAGDTLLGWNPPEVLPLVGKPARELLPGRRANIVKAGTLKRLLFGDGEAQLTSGEGKSHLFSLGEFYAMYLLAWSETLWPTVLPQAQDIYPDEYRVYAPAVESAKNPWHMENGGTIPHASLFAGFATELERLKASRDALPAIRRALANIPSMMMFDDHEVTDDWYIHRTWCTDALGSELGARIIQHALTAYAIFQAWGNTPERFALSGTTGEAGRELLAACSRWSGDAASPELTRIRQRVGLPDAASVQTQKKVTHPPGALDWHYAWSYVAGGPAYEVIALDTRTWRGFPDGRKDPPRLISDAATIARQIPTTPPPPSGGVTIVIAPAPVVGVHLVEHYVQGKAPTAAAEMVDREAWTLQQETFELLLSALFARNPRLVVLSGDVHYGFSAHLSYWATRPYGQPPPAQPTVRSGVLAQLTSSALKNESAWPPTHALHDEGFTVCSGLPDPQRKAGWNDPTRFWYFNSLQRVGSPWSSWDHTGDPPMVNTDKTFGPGSPFFVTAQPDWRYQIDYLLSAPRVPSAGTQVPAPPSWTRETAMSTWISTLERYEAYVRETAPGMEIVGWNNLGEVTFQWGEGDAKAVVHKLWWWLTPQAEPFPISRYTVRLALNDPQYPMPGPIQVRGQR